jgi:anti-sigma regulatory factor (Ser/Thr protein kinase)
MQAGDGATRIFRATAEDIGEMDGWLETLGTQWGIPDRTMFRARVCVSELAANVLEHGRSGPDGDEIVITLRSLAPAIEIEIADTGNPFDPLKLPEPVGAPDATHGRGLAIVHRYASDLAYRRERDRNVLLFRVSAL